MLKENQLAILTVSGEALLNQALSVPQFWNGLHYGTGIPLREDVAFALGLCTDLLQFAGQVLRAHPDPIASVS